MKPDISFDDFSKLDVRVATIVKVEEVEGADRLYKMTLDVGPEIGERVIASGIKPWYTPEDLEGKQVLYLANLEPKVFRGIESQGMLLAADDGQAVLVHPDREITPGSKIK